MDEDELEKIENKIKKLEKVLKEMKNKGEAHPIFLAGAEESIRVFKSHLNLETGSKNTNCYYFDCAYSITGYLRYEIIKKCHVCEMENLEGIAFDTSDGEYGSVEVCWKCLNILKEKSKIKR